MEEELSKKVMALESENSKLKLEVERLQKWLASEAKLKVEAQKRIQVLEHSIRNFGLAMGSGDET